MWLALTHQEDGPPSPLRRHRSPAGVSERRRLREDGLVGSPADLGLEMHAKELATNPSTMSPYTRPPCPRAIQQAHHGVGGNVPADAAFVLSLSKDGRTRLAVARHTLAPTRCAS